MLVETGVAISLGSQCFPRMIEGAASTPQFGNAHLSGRDMDVATDLQKCCCPLVPVATNVSVGENTHMACDVTGSASPIGVEERGKVRNCARK